LNTPDNQGYYNQWLTFKSGKQSLNIEVRACANAHLRLTQLPFSSPLYDVILGSDSNTKSKILRYSNGDVVAVAEEVTPGIVSCFEWRRFDVSWASNKIKVSLGSSSGQTILDWQEDQRQVRVFAVGLSTGPQSDGNWKLFHNQGMTIVWIPLL
jgi:Farnesoic acid 0-methyl transferase